jgi:hypothetical protein
MDANTKHRTKHAGGWATVGGAAAVATGATPIGIAVAAGVGGALAWRLLAPRRD